MSFKNAQDGEFVLGNTYRLLGFRHLISEFVTIVTKARTGSRFYVSPRIRKRLDQSISETEPSSEFGLPRNAPRERFYVGLNVSVTVFPAACVILDVPAARPASALELWSSGLLAFAAVSPPETALGLSHLTCPSQAR